MGVVATDNFNRADNADLGTNWTVQTGNQAWKILSNTAQPSALSGSNVCEQYSGTSWANDQYSQAVVSATGTHTLDAGLGLAVRCAAAANTLYAAFTSTTNSGGNFSDIYKFVAGTGTRLAQTDTSGALATSETLYLEVQGTSLVYKRNGTTRATATDSAIASGKPGIFLSTDVTGSPALDNWEGGDFASASLPPGLNGSLLMDAYTQAAGALLNW